MGHVQILREFAVAPGGVARTLRIYTPDAYDAEPGRRFPVLYMQDGQNVFAHPESAREQTWAANHAIETVAYEGRSEPWIIVGVDHGPERLSDYSPWDEPALGVRGRGPETLRYLTDELKPWIDRTYRTKPEGQQTAIMGSSLGGLFAIYAGLARGDVFGRVGAVSPTMLWSVGELEKRWSKHAGRWSRLYLDAGTSEGIFAPGLPMDYAGAVHRFAKHLEGVGYQPWELKLVIEQNGTHDEGSWARRLPEIMRWLLGSW
jgi:predicted alpha/beta superfamily hydrolase